MLSKGDRVPDVELVAPDSAKISPADFRGHKLVLYFYPKDDTPGCTREAQDFTELADAFEKAGTWVVGVSKDSPASHDRFAGKYDLKIRLASDVDGRACEAFGVSMDDLLSTSRAAPIAWPRQVAMYLARELTDQTLPAIGRAFGGRNHTTVMHACRRTAERMASDPEAYDTVRRLTAELGGRR